MRTRSSPTRVLVLGLVLVGLTHLAQGAPEDPLCDARNGGIKAALKRIFKRNKPPRIEAVDPAPTSLQKAVAQSKAGIAQWVEYNTIRAPKGQPMMVFNARVRAYVFEAGDQIFLADTPEALQAARNGAGAREDIKVISKDQWFGSVDYEEAKHGKVHARNLKARENRPPEAPAAPKPQVKPPPVAAGEATVAINGKRFPIVEVRVNDPKLNFVAVLVKDEKGHTVLVNVPRAKFEDVQVRAVLAAPDDPWIFQRPSAGGGRIRFQAQVVMDGSGPSLNAAHDALLVISNDGKISEVPIRDFGLYPPERARPNNAPGGKTIYTKDVSINGTVLGGKPGGLRPDPAKKAAYKSAFSGADGLVSARDFFQIEVEDGKVINMSLKEREAAMASGKIYEDYDLSKLPRGRTYTWVILEDGTRVFGEVTDGFEFGVKHGHLANGRKVVASGEMLVAENGNVVYNFTSGTFAKPLLRDRAAALVKAGKVKNIKEGLDLALSEMRSRVDAGFRVDLEGTGAKARYTDTKTLVPTVAPEDLKRAYCWNAAFLAWNAHWCD